MHARHARVRVRLGCVSLVLAGLLAGCGGPATSEGPSSATDSKATTRRKDMENFMKTQPPVGNK
jgi:hypothetical protein